MNLRPNACALALLALALAPWATPALAQNKGGGGGSTTPTSGVITIDQAKAEAGGVTAGDAAGFPITISQPGSYRLMSNLTLADPNVTAIEITADDVTIDLNGFTVSTPMTCSGSLSAWNCSVVGPQGHGILAINHSYTTLRNGHVRGFRNGVSLQLGAIVEGVSARHFWTSGIKVGSHSLVQDSTVALAANGIEVGGGSIVRHNAIGGIGTNGVSSTQGSLVLGNRIASVGGWGVLSTGGAVRDNLFSGYGYGAFNANTVSLGDAQSNLCNAVRC
jgi:hypothetical protein